MLALALVLGFIGTFGAIWAIFQALHIATQKPAKFTTLPNGLYKVTSTKSGAYDLELVEEDKDDKKEF